MAKEVTSAGHTTITCLRMFLLTMPMSTGVPLPTRLLRVSLDVLFPFPVSSSFGCNIFPNQDILQLWQDDSVQLVYSQRHSYWLLDAAAYYFNNVER